MIVYMTTNLVTGKRYIGADSKNNPDYIGSGKILLKAIKKHGKENFKKEILERCQDQAHLREREKYWVRYYNADKSPNFYNLSYGGQGGVKGRKPWNFGVKMDKDSKIYKKMYIDRAEADKSYLTEDWKTEHSGRITQSQKFQKNKNKKVKSRKANGKPWHSKETIEKIRNKAVGREKTPEEIEKRINTIRKNGTLQGGNNPLAKSVTVKNLINETIKKFDTIKDAEKYYGISRWHMKKGTYNNLEFKINCTDG